jgi:phage terminase small subunit
MAELDNKRYERFCQEYAVDYSGTQAAIRAGYKEKNARSQASTLLTIPNILARVRELQHEQVERLAVTQDYVVLQLLETYQRCLEETPVLKFDPDTGQMEETGKYQFDSKGALRALELLGKHLGMYNDKLHVTGKVDTGQLDNVLRQLRGDGGG